MKTTKNLLLVALSMIIVISIILFSCNRYKGTRSSSIFEGEKEYVLPPLSGTGGGLQFNGYTLLPNSLSQEEQNDYYDPEYNFTVLFNNGDIPALITSSNGTILATAGTSNSVLVVKRSTDMGKTWSPITVNGTQESSSYSRPFFINCHNGDVLLGITSNQNNQGKQTQIFRSCDNGNTWTNQTNINFTNVCAATKDCFVTFGQGVTLRHQSDKSSKKLMFPYYFYIDSSVADPKKTNDGNMTLTMISTDDGKTWSNGFYKYNNQIKTNGMGPFSGAVEPKFIELTNGNILSAMELKSGKCFYFYSTDCGSNWNIYSSLNNVSDIGKHVDFTRYEFNGKPLAINGKSALMAYSSDGGSYSVRMTTNDFANKNSYEYKNEEIINVGESEPDGYPAITVLQDGTIATLTEEGGGKIVFRRFNLYWLTGGNDAVDYSKSITN